MREKLQKEYRIDYQIENNHLHSVLVQVDGREEHYLSKHEIDMLIAEWVHNNGRFIIDDKK